MAIGSLAAVAILAMAILQISKLNSSYQLDRAREQVANYSQYQFTNGEYNKLKKSEKNDVYYYAADGKRYVFPTVETYYSWFRQIQVSDVNTFSLVQLYETPLGGNVTCRPGTLIQTPTDNNVYIVIKNGHIRALSQDLLNLVYNYNWKRYVISVPNFFFINYIVDKPINDLSDFPEIPKSITIDQDKGLNK